jgi:hypothetical protein
MEVTENWGRKRKQLLDDLKEKGGYSKLKKRKHRIAPCREVTLEEAMYLS